MDISFVIPCYRSEKTIGIVINEIIEVMQQKTELTYDIIAVSDNSPDHVYQVLKEIAASNPAVKAVELAKNMGQHAAIMAGMRFAKGDYVVFLDDDGQCPLDKLWQLMEPMEQGADACFAKYGYKKESLFRNMGSWFNDWLMQKLLEKPKDLQLSNFWVMKQFVVQEALKYKNPYPYISGLMLRTTSRIVNVPMKDRERMMGTSGYTLKKLVKLLSNGLTAFSVKPLRIATVAGTICSFGGFLYGLYIIINKLLNFSRINEGYSSMMAVILFIGGMIMLMLGIIGEYVGRIYICLNNSPQYVIRDTVNIDSIIDNEVE